MKVAKVQPRRGVRTAHEESLSLRN
jgi:hypothetical protein